MSTRLTYQRLPSSRIFTVHRVQSSFFRVTTALSGKFSFAKMSTDAGTATEGEQQQRQQEEQPSLKDLVQIPAGQDDDEILSKLKPLITPDSHQKSPLWKLVLDGKGIQRSFRFKTFNKTWV